VRACVRACVRVLLAVGVEALCFRPVCPSVHVCEPSIGIF